MAWFGSTLAFITIFSAIGIVVGLIWFFISLIIKKEKKIPLLVIAISFSLALIFGIVGSILFPSSNISEEEYNAAVLKADEYAQITESLESDISTLTEEKEAIQNEYDNYKESMSEYEGLAAAEAESRRIQAESIAVAEQEAKEQAEAESLAAKEAEEKAGYETGITYDQLARTPDEFEGDKVKFTGEVIQVIEGNNTIQIRLAVNGDYDNILFCEYSKDIVESRVLENDTITIYGTSYGLYSYQSTMGGQITIPAVIIDKIDQ